jgi:hypothetical protein
MSTQIILDLPEETYRRAERLAQLTRRPVADVVAETVTLSLPYFDLPPAPVRPWHEVSDKELLALADLQMNGEDDQRLSQLLYRQQAGTLTEIERGELARLMQHYQESLLLKAEALSEAVQRGLRPPLSP